MLTLPYKGFVMVKVCCHQMLQQNVKLSTHCLCPDVFKKVALPHITFILVANNSMDLCHSFYGVVALK